MSVFLHLLVQVSTMVMSVAMAGDTQCEVRGMVLVQVLLYTAVHMYLVYLQDMAGMTAAHALQVFSPLLCI